jgi:ABC-type nitrate/sulfonate/bicarbonate transport system substrate-binding protein
MDDAPPKGKVRKSRTRTILTVVAVVVVVAAAGVFAFLKFGPRPTVPLPPITEERKSVAIGKLGKTEMFLHIQKVFDPKTIEYAKLDGEPSQNHYFKPVKDEGILDREYPAYDAKTFKFLALPTAAIPPQDYYMFTKDGGTLNPALASSGYKAVDIIDTGHVKILPNLYTGYYDFAWIPLAVMTEYWSGNESMNQELWKQGNDYVVIGSSTDGDSSLMSPQDFPDVKSLDGKSVGIMNVSFNTEALLNKILGTVGLSTSAVGGTVNVEMGSPGFVMNDTVSNKLAAVFSWSIYTKALQKQFNYKELVKWQDLGYGTKLTNVVLVVRRDILKKHPDLVQKVVQLNYDASQQAINVGDYAKPGAARYQQWNDTYTGDGRKVSDLGVPNLDSEANPAFLRDTYDYMVKCGYFKVPYPFEDLVNLSFESAVVK